MPSGREDSNISQGWTAFCGLWMAAFGGTATPLAGADAAVPVKMQPLD